MKDIVTIGGAGAGWGDGKIAMRQFMDAGGLDYIVLDCLSEFFLPIMRRLSASAPNAGYAQFFTDELVKPHLAALKTTSTKIVTNAGGANPAACATRLNEIARESGIDINVAYVDGDDLTAEVAEFTARGLLEPPVSETQRVSGLHVYLGAEPIARALAEGADIVVTGRVVDSALVLGPLIHEFGWDMADFDHLAAGSLIGHLLECGAQATGGLFTDWRDVPDWANIGYPIAECRPDGRAVITKAPGTGGLVSFGTIAEQMLYEIADPQRYILPDVITDMSAVRLSEVGPNRVLVEGARGYAPTPTCKVGVAIEDGWRGVLTITTRGPAAVEKARRCAEELLHRGESLLRLSNLGGFTSFKIETIGADETFGDRSRPSGREAVARLAFEHPTREGVELLVKESSVASVSLAPGNMGSTLGSSVAPVARVSSFLIPKGEVVARVHVNDREFGLPFDLGITSIDPKINPTHDYAVLELDGVELLPQPLASLAWLRSGDKGNDANVGVIARQPHFLPYIARALTAEAVSHWYRHVFDTARHEVTRYPLPGVQGLNFLLHDSLGGGCTSNLRFDALAKSMAQDLLDFPVPLPAELAARISSDN